MSLRPTSALPLYARVEATLTEEITGGQLREGSQLPSEDSLIRRFAVSRTTIRQAIQNLTKRGLVEIRRGKGTFVTRPKIVQELTALTGFVEDMRAAGRSPTARVLEKKVVAASEAVARHLALREGSQVVRIRRVRLADGNTVSFDETYLPRAIGEKIMSDDLEAEPIFSLLEEKYSIPLVEAEYRLEAIAANGVVARALGVRVGSPVFFIERTSYRAGHEPIDYERLYYRGDQVSFVTRLSRRTSAASRAATKGAKQ